MSDWGITTKVPAEVVLAEGITLAGDLHLYARTTYPPGPETPLEMLNRDDGFFALTLEGGGVTFIPKTQVVVVSCRDRPRLLDPERESAARHIELEVVVQGGTEYRGRAALELPPSRARSARLSERTGRLLRPRSRRHQLVHQQVARPFRAPPRLRLPVARLDRLIQVLHEQRADALQLAVGKPAALVSNGSARPLTREPLTDAQILSLVREVADPASIPRLGGGEPVSFPYRSPSGAGDASRSRPAPAGRWSRSAPTRPPRRPAGGAVVTGGRSSAELAEARAAMDELLPPAGERRRVRSPPPERTSRRSCGTTASWAARTARRSRPSAWRRCSSAS